MRIGAIARAYTAVLSVATHAQADVLKRSRRSRLGTSRRSRILDGSTITGMSRVRGSSRRRRNTSYNEYEYVGFGLRSDDSRDRMEEAVEVLTRAWTEELLVHDGKFFSVRLSAIRPCSV